MKIQCIYGDESQLIEEKKLKFLHALPDLPLITLDEESNPSYICEQLQEDSLFGDERVFCLVNLPVVVQGKRSIPEAWKPVRELLMSYRGDSSVLLIFHGLLDEKNKDNAAFLKAVPAECCKKLSKGELLHWIRTYIKDNGYQLQHDADAYLRMMFELWDDVPVSFMRTELDRCFLELGDHKQITKGFLEETLSDYGAKNIFAFTDAIMDRNAKVLKELMPYVLKPQEMDRALSYITGTLQLYVMVGECRYTGMEEDAIVRLFKERGYNIHPYRIKLAYKQSRQVSQVALQRLLQSMYEVIRKSRLGQGSMTAFQDICLSYCEW